MGANNGDEIDCGNFFDRIDDLIDFPLDDNEVGSGGACDDGRLVGSIESHGFPSWNDALADSDPFLSNGNVNSGPGFSVELPVPHEDVMQLEWLSTFVEESFSSAGLTIGKDNAKKESLIAPSPNQFQILSSLSVLESTISSSSGGKTMPPLVPQRARSKCPRPATFNPWPVIKLLSPSFSETSPNPFLGFSEPDGFAESPPIKKKIRKNPEEGCQTKNKKMKREFAEEPPADGGSARKCLHCQVTKTPQWRCGPLGPKTLCNACGVRFNSGRLFPEYRPAANPTFVPFLHSNSHKKVVEMRSIFGPGDSGVEQMHIGDPEVVNA